MKESNGFLVVLPEQIIENPQNSNLSWLRMFYALPKELAARRYGLTVAFHGCGCYEF